MNTFYHGDCLFVLRHDIAPESIDLIYLDPPFFTGKIQKGTKNGDRELWKYLLRILKNSGVKVKRWKQ